MFKRRLREELGGDREGKAITRARGSSGSGESGRDEGRVGSGR